MTDARSLRFQPTLSRQRLHRILAVWAASAAVAVLFVGLPSPAQAKGVGDYCGFFKKGCPSNLSCVRSPAVKRCVPKASTYAEESRSQGQNCYDNTDCQADLVCRGGRDRDYHKRTCQPQPVTSVENLENGDVFPCACNSKSFPGGTMVKTNQVYSADEDHGRLIVKFSDKRPIKNEAARRFFATSSFAAGFLGFFITNGIDWGGLFLGCKCAVVDDLTLPWTPSDGGQNDKGYETWCVGFCGAHCGETSTGLTTARKRYGGLIKHDICQAYIGSTAAIYELEGFSNACSDEGLKGGIFSLPSSILTQPGSCTDGPLPVFPDYEPPASVIQLRAQHSALCLSADPETAQVVQQDCAENEHAEWDALPNFDDGTYTIVNNVSGLCLAVADASTGNVADIVTENCASAASQRWDIQAREDGSVNLIAKHSDRCMDIFAAETTSGTRAIQYDCHDGTNQAFDVVNLQ